MDIYIHPTRQQMGAASARVAGAAIRDLINRHGRAVVVFASAPSQNEFLDTLASASGLDWSRVEAFHLDEYVGISADHPASFRSFLHDRLWQRVQPAAFHELRGDAPDPVAEAQRYAELLAAHPPMLGCLGIGENGHLAFNDPPADFEDPQAVRIVELDQVCRTQQVHDGCFAQLEQVPRTALTMSMSAITRIPQLVVTVPGRAKAEAVRRTVEGAVSPHCPASVLQRHPKTSLFLDDDSASQLRSIKR